MNLDIQLSNMKSLRQYWHSLIMQRFFAHAGKVYFGVPDRTPQLSQIPLMAGYCRSWGRRMGDNINFAAGQQFTITSFQITAGNA